MAAFLIEIVVLFKYGIALPLLTHLGLYPTTGYNSCYQGSAIPDVYLNNTTISILNAAMEVTLANAGYGRLLEIGVGPDFELKFRKCGGF